MIAKKSSSLNVLLIFFLSYSFYTIQILSQLLFKYYSKQSSSIICLFFLLFPIAVYFICKKINTNKEKCNESRNKVLSIISVFYLIFTTIISTVYISNIILIYYYQQTSMIILLIFLSLPIIYTLIKGEHNFFSLASILLIIYIFFKYAYLKNSSYIDFYVFYDFFKIDSSNILSIIILCLPMFLEPLLLFNEEKNMSNKINMKFVLIFSIILSLVGILTILRQTWEFGNLLGNIRFPYLESAKNIVAGRFFENIDYYYLLSLSVSVYTRLGFTITSIKTSFNLNKITTLLILFVILLLTYLLHSNIEIAEYITDKILFTSSLLLIMIIIILPFINRRRKVNNGY